ncbi:MAG TPA: DsbC family protein [Burkholderiales bacterium]|nr:DsbC family protein [Burkholderiales bacterium]
MLRHVIFCLAFLIALPAAANEALIRQNLEPRLGGARIEGIEPAPVGGLFEVRFRTQEGVQIIYTDAAGNYVLQGRLFDLRSERDLTEERLRKLNAISFRSLPLEQAVKIQRGSGARVMAMFSDPYCPACRRFEKELAKIDDVTIYVFMYPVIRPANKDHSKAVWCSADRARAWLELAAAPAPKVPQAAPKCANPVERNLALGQALGVNSTPTVYLGNGEKLAGMLPARELEHLLDQAATSRR